MLLTSLCHHVTAVTLSNHHQRSTVSLELIHIGIHTVGGGGTHRATRITLWCLGRSCIQHRILLEVVGQSLTGIQTGLQLGMSDITGYNDGTLQVDAGADGIF